MKLHRLAYLGMAALSIFLAMLATVHGDGDSHPSEYCTSKNCRTVARQLLLSQNQSVNPCDDFYAHACTGQNGFNFFYTTRKILDEISDALEIIQPSDMEALKKAAKFYNVCTNEDAITRRGLKPIERILSDNGEWPATDASDKWNNQNRSWLEIHENFAKNTGISTLFDATVEIDRRNTGAHILWLSVPTVPSERAHMFARTKRETRSSAYRRYVVQVVKKLQKSRRPDVKYDDLLADPEGVIEFEDELLKLAINLNRDFNNNDDDLRITTIEALQNEWDAVVPKIANYSINWLNVINDRFEGTDIVVDASEKIALVPAAFIANFTRLLINTPVKTIVNYVHWKVIDNLLHGVDLGFWNPHAKQRASVSTQTQMCVSNHRMLHAIAYIYVKNHFDVRSKTAALEMIQNIQDEIKREVRESSWLDEPTKLVVKKKIESMEKIVGYPEWYDEPGKIDEYYREYTVGPKHFENILAYDKFERKKRMSKLRSPVDGTEKEWNALPFIVNAGYSPKTNAFNIPAAILQFPFFDNEMPSVLNYGSIGTIVGHEISHALDNHGRLYDEAGRKRKWWPQSAIDAYKSKAQCFIEQFDKYAVVINNKTVHLNGTEMQAENVADTMGLQAGLRAYKTLRNNGKTNNVKIDLPNSFNDEQLYFYGLAYNFCGQGPIKRLPSGHLNIHSPPRFRINGAVSNIQEFADAFHCPLGSPMNPPKKCLIWD